MAGGIQVIEQNAKAAIVLAGGRVGFWAFLGSAIVAYLTAAGAMLFGGPLGMVASMLIGSVTTILLVYGLILFALQRPFVALITVGVLACIHICLLQAHVPAGLFWPVWSRSGLHWMEAHGF
jgi:hypothetical protein